MIYVMSDIHGYYEAYLNMLEIIQLCPDDTLYIVGDVIDRGDHGVKILQHIMTQENIILIRGNHEQAMLDEVSERARRFTSKGHWQYGLGGLPTWTEYKALPDDQQQAIYSYVEATRLELHIEVDGLPYHLIHGRPSREDNRKLWGRFERWDVIRYPNTEFVVFGHTPTIRYQKVEPMRIFFGDSGLIGIDCGCAYQEYPGRLGCLCLNDWKEFYMDI